MIAHDLAGAFQEFEHIGQQMDVALLHGPFLRGGCGPAGHAVQGDVIVDALEIGRAVTVIVGHDLLADEVGVAEGIFVQVALEAQFVLKICHGGEHVALPVGTHRRAQTHVEDVGSGLGRRAAGRYEKTVRVMAMVMQNQFRPGLAQGADQSGHEARRADAAHILEPQDDMA